MRTCRQFSENLELIFKIFRSKMANKTEILLVTPNLAKMYTLDSKFEIALGLADLWYFDEHQLYTIVMGPLLIFPRCIICNAADRMHKISNLPISQPLG